MSDRAYPSTQLSLELNKEGTALWDLGRYLIEHDYHFVTVTPETHRRVLERNKVSQPHCVLRDLFGWSREVEVSRVPADVVQLLEEGNALQRTGPSMKSLVRYSSFENSLVVHSAFPTTGADSVFFGPDTYRFARFLSAKARPARSVTDLGCGTGAGGIAIFRQQRHLHPSLKFHFTDINPVALQFAAINVRLSKMENVSFIESDLMSEVPKGDDLVVANPPFIIDPDRRSYRDGGGAHGSELSTRMLVSALDYLAPGGQVAMYTGTCIVDGEDIFLKRARDILKGQHFEYEELDPDIFGEELSSAAYADVERIAAVGLWFRKT